MIPFNRPPITGREEQYILEVLGSPKISGDGPFSLLCHGWFEKNLPCKKAFLTPSCTAALEMAALLIDIEPGDEVIMPSYTFVSTANAFALRGAKIIFVDIRPDTMNINEALIEAAITSKTKAIVPVHYAGVACDMDTIMQIASRHGLYVVEDAAQGMMSRYKDRSLGTIGHLGAYSFHETKNYTSGGEGGLLIINDDKFTERAEVIREKGTNRSQFFRGMVDKYQWVDLGSSYLPSELQAAYLWGQLDYVDNINADRTSTWQAYWSQLSPLRDAGAIELGAVPTDTIHNGHMFYLKVANLEQRTLFIDHLRAVGVMALFHYVPLHASNAGKLLASFTGEDRFTTSESERLVRLPLWYGLSEGECDFVLEATKGFYKNFF